MPNSADLQRRHVLVTGGARGIGLSIALAAKKAGAAVTVLARSEPDLEFAQRELQLIRPDVRALALRCDVSSEHEVKAQFANAVAEQGPIYGLICAAGVYGALGAFRDVEFSEWQKTIDINLIGTARSIHCALPHMVSADGARIILFSGGGQGPMPNFSDYVTSKGAIWRLTETLGAELAPQKIFVNAVAPGAVNTRLLDDLLEAGPDRIGRDVYEKSLKQKEAGGQSSEKAAELCLYLLSEKATGLYGKTISAVWDSYHDLKNLDQTSQSDLFCYRRVVDEKGNTRA